MRPGNNGHHNRIRTSGRNLQSRARLQINSILVEDNEPEFDLGEVEETKPRRFMAQDDDEDDLTEAVARAQARRELLQQEENRSRLNTKVTQETPGTKKASDQVEVDDDWDDENEDEAEQPSKSVPQITQEEAKRRSRWDRVIWKRLGTSGQSRLEGIKDTALLKSQTSYDVVCFGAMLRGRQGQAYEAHVELCSSEVLGSRKQHKARHKESSADLRGSNQAVASYNAWVAENRPELADHDLLECLAGSKDDRAEAKTKLVEFDLKYLAGSRGKVKPKVVEASVDVPLMYQKEYRGRVRAYPEWVAPVLRKLAKKRGQNIPAMVFVLSQLAYWLEPKDATGEPRARRTKQINGQWWIVFGYGEIEKQTPVSKGQARDAIKHLKALNLIEVTTPAKASVESTTGGVNYGPNTKFLRINHTVLEPLIREAMSGQSNKWILES